MPAREWSQEVVQDCQANFRGMRQALEAALTASGKFTVARSDPRPHTLILEGRVSDIGLSSTTFMRDGSDSTTSSVDASVQYTLEDANGDTVFGNLLTRTMPLAQNMETPGMASASTQSGRTIYTRMQREVAMAIARRGLQDVPSARDRRDTRTSGAQLPERFHPHRIGRLRHGWQRHLDDQVHRRAGCRRVRPLVPDGGGDLSSVQVGGMVDIVDADDPAARGRRFERADLPPA